MKKMKALIIAILIVSVACSQSKVKLPGKSKLKTVYEYVEPSDGTTGDNAYFFGNSITFGLNASPRLTKRWSTVLSTAAGLTESNYGISGTTLVPNACWTNFDTSTIVTKTASGRFLFISYGVNDAFNTDITAAEFKASMKDAIQAAINRGWNPMRVIVNSPFYTNRIAPSMSGPCTMSPTPESGKQLFVTAAKEAAAEKGAYFIDVFNYMKNYGGLVDTDSVHPTTIGHQVIADYIKLRLQL